MGEKNYLLFGTEIEPAGDPIEACQDDTFDMADTILGDTLGEDE